VTNRPRTRPSVNARSRQHFARLISSHLQKAVESFVSAGKLLQEARHELDHGEFQKMLREDLHFDVTKAQRLMAVARHCIIGNAAHALHLPPSEYTLYLLTTLPDTLLQQMLADGRIHPGLERKEVEQIVKSLKQASRRGNLYNLISRLETVDPARARTTVIPLLTMFWFTGEHLLAYNDQIAIAVKFDSGFKGAVSCALLTLLRLAEFADDIEINGTTDGKLRISEANGRVRLTLQMQPPPFRFTMPKPNPRRPTYHTDELVKAIEHCLISAVATKPNTSEHLGVTLVPKRDSLALYGSDGNSISFAKVAISDWSHGRVILPTAFCVQMVALSKGHPHEHGSLQINRQHALFRCGDTVLCGRLVSQQNHPLDFGSVVDRISPSPTALVDIPDRFRSAVELACAVHALVRLDVAAGHLRFRSQTATEDIEVAMPISEAHPDIAGVVHPELLRRDTACTKMLITPKCVAMSNGLGDFYLVACHDVSDEAAETDDTSVEPLAA
jgi:hypothetical protein